MGPGPRGNPVESGPLRWLSLVLGSVLLGGLLVVWICRDDAGAILEAYLGDANPFASESRWASDEGSVGLVRADPDLHPTGSEAWAAAWVANGLVDAGESVPGALPTSMAGFGRLDSLALPDGAVVAALAPHLSRLVGLAELTVPAPATLDTTTCVHLARIPGLARVDLSGCTVDPGGLAALAAAPGLVGLSLERCRSLADVDFAPLATARGLEDLRVAETFFGDTGLAAVVGLPRLWKLVAARSRVRGLGIPGGFPALRVLDLDGCPLAPGAFDREGAFPGLERLSLHGAAGVDRALIGRLASGKRLTVLGLGDQPLDPGDLVYLAGLPALRELGLAGCGRLRSQDLGNLAASGTLTRVVFEGWDEARSTLPPDSSLTVEDGTYLASSSGALGYDEILDRAEEATSGAGDAPSVHTEEEFETPATGP